jgi:hypothetical protein
MKRRKKAVAEMIYDRLENAADSLSDSQFTALVNKFGVLTTKRRRRSRKDPDEAKTRGPQSFVDRLTGEELEMHKEILRIEAERLEKGREEYSKRMGIIDA